MADLLAARVLGARLGFAHLQVVALRDLAVCVGGYRNLAGAVLRVSRELVQRRNLVERHPDDAGTRRGKLVVVLRERVRLGVAAAGEGRWIEVDDDRALLQSILERELELLAGERCRCRELRRLVAFL